MPIILYILSIIIAYFLFRQLLKTPDGDCYPTLVFIIILFLPYVNIVISLILLIIEYANQYLKNKNIKINYNRIFFIKEK